MNHLAITTRPLHLDHPTRPRPAPRRTDLRSGSIPDLQLIAGVGPYEIDVLIRMLGEGRIEIVGQVTGAERIQEAIAQLPLALYETGGLTCVARAETDAFGEFQLHGKASGRYVLALGASRAAPCLLIYEGGAHVASSQARV